MKRQIRAWSKKAKAKKTPNMIFPWDEFKGTVPQKTQKLESSSEAKSLFGNKNTFWKFELCARHSWILENFLEQITPMINEILKCRKESSPIKEIAKKSIIGTI